MWNENIRWHYDYARLAKDSGFIFGKYKDTNSDFVLRSIDVNQIIEDRDFGGLEKCMPIVIKFTLTNQNEILDENFIKTFRICQLSVEYLLFCKKYLDETVVLLKNECSKLKEENSELRTFTEELKHHVDELMQKLKEQEIAFACDFCDKVFANNQYLAAHKKRRHTNDLDETQKLQMEIKELKSRLNSTEKMLQDQNVSKPVKDDTNEQIQNLECYTKLHSLQEKFEELRIYVENELQNLKKRPDVEEKCAQLIENAFERIEAIQTKPEKNPLEDKVETSLQKIETQMQTFWHKLNEIGEMNKEFKLETNKPEIKPRTKFTQPNVIVNDPEKDADDSAVNVNQIYINEDEKLEEIGENAPTSELIGENSKEISDKIPDEDKLDGEDRFTETHMDETTRICESTEKRPKSGRLQRKLVRSFTIDESSDISLEEPQGKIQEKIPTADSDESSVHLLDLPKKQPSRSTLGKKSITSLRKIAQDESVLDSFRLEIENILIKRLQDIGVSPDWNGIPEKSFTESLRIINHQANLLKKTYPDFDRIQQRLIKEIARQIKRPTVKEIEKKIQTIEIKNRELYDTDSENEYEIKQPYMAVIQELKSLRDRSSDSDSQPKMKSVLKNYPSVVSLTKKKVLFDLERIADDDVRNGKPEINSLKDGGSTTSIASSVLDKQHEFDEDLSDFDYSTQS